jgi:hypothetical protein
MLGLGGLNGITHVDGACLICTNDYDASTLRVELPDQAAANPRLSVFGLLEQFSRAVEDLLVTIDSGLAQNLGGGFRVRLRVFGIVRKGSTPLWAGLTRTCGRSATSGQRSHP